MSLITRGQLQVRVLQAAFSQRSFCAVRIWTSLRRVAACACAARRISSGGTKDPASDPCSVIFASPPSPALSVFGRPGSALTCDA